VRRSIITVRVRRTGSGVDARRGRGRAATEKATGVNKPAQAEAARAHTHRASLCARETVPKAALHCSLSNRIFFCGLLFSFLVAKSARPNECLLCSTPLLGVHLPGTPRDTPRSRLLHRPAFPRLLVRPLSSPKSLPLLYRGRCRTAGTAPAPARRGFGCSKLRDGPSLSTTSTCHCNELGNGKQGGEHLPRPALRFCSLLHTALIRN
jgi:hypothetical protein